MYECKSGKVALSACLVQGKELLEGTLQAISLLLEGLKIGKESNRYAYSFIMRFKHIMPVWEAHRSTRSKDFAVPK